MQQIFVINRTLFVPQKSPGSILGSLWVHFFSSTVLLLLSDVCFFGFQQMSELTGGEVNGEVAGFKGRRLLHVVLSDVLW